MKRTSQINFVLAVLLALLPGNLAFSQPIPTNEWVNFFSTNTTLDGTSVPVGAVVNAYDPDGVWCGTFTVHTEGEYGFLLVYRDDTTTPDVDEGASPGDTITFHINHNLAIPLGPGVPVWTTNGDIIQLNLEGHSNYQLDSLALVALYDSTNGANWTNNTNWLTGPVSTWYGITVSGGRVTEVNLENNYLVGTIPSEIGNITNLTYLNFYFNQLTGSIPTEIGNLINLQHLSLHGNQLTGTIPIEMGNLINLIELRLSDNLLTGSIPATIGNLTNLTWLDLHSNQLTGSIPPEIGNLTNLTQLHIGLNQLTGSIPSEIGNLANLQNLELSSNQLTGSIPPEFGNLANLGTLDLSFNQLSGSIPPEIGNLTNLQYLTLEANQLTGSIPPEIYNMINLNILILENNQLTGSIPPEIGNLINLTFLDFWGNQLSGFIPSEIGNLTNLAGLDLGANQLTGSIPIEIGNLMNLNGLRLCINQLTGSIPPSIGNLTNLTIIRLEANQLTGTVPNSFTGLTELVRLWLYSNQLIDLPDLSPLDSLNELKIEINKFTFEDIEPNIGVPDSVFTYSPQDSVGTEQDTTLNPGSSLTVSVTVGGANNQYQWKKDGTNIGTQSSDSSYTIDPVDFADAGAYTCEITNTVATELTLNSRPINVTVIDTTAPAVPHNLTATPGDHQVTLNWLPNTESDLSHYVIYRNTTPFPGDSIGVVYAPDTFYVDYGLNVTVPNYYAVTAVDTAGLVSSFSHILEVSYPIVSASTDLVEFGTVIADNPETQVLTLYNDGSDTLEIDDMFIAGGEANYFNVELGTGKDGLNGGSSEVSGFSLHYNWREQLVTTSTPIVGGKQWSRTQKVEHKKDSSLRSASWRRSNLVNHQDKKTGLPRHPDSIGTPRLSDPDWSGAGNDTAERSSRIIDIGTEQRAQIFGRTSVDRISTDILPGDSLGLLVTFAPSDTGDFADELIIMSDDPTGSDILTVTLSGLAIAPFLTFSLEHIDFGSIFVDSTAFRSMMLRNTGGAPLEVSAITSSDQAHYSVTPGAIPLIESGDSAQIIITFTPSALDTFPAAVTINSNDLFDPVQTIELHGVGSPHNYLPSVVIFPLEQEEFDTVLIYYSLSDADDDILSLTFQYLSDDSTTWIDAKILEVDELTVIEPLNYSGVSHWISQFDFPEQEAPQVLLRSIVTDIYGSSETVITVHIDNYHGELTIDPLDGEYGGDVEIHYTITDPWVDVFSITPQYFDSLSGEWTDATVTGELVGIGAVNYSGNITWLTREDLPSNEDPILFRMMPHDGLKFGTGDTIPIAVDNVAPPQLVAYGPTISNVTSWTGLEIPMSFSSEIDESTIENGITVEGEISGSHNFDFSYNSETKTVVLFPETVFAGAETVTVTISTLLTDTFSIPFDGNGNGDLDPDEDSFSWQFVTTLLGDYTTNGIVNYIDLADFREAWVDTKLHIVRNIGPAEGEVPKLLPIQDSLFNFEDLMVFAQMWNWSYENEDYTDSTQMLAKIEDTDNPVGLTLNFSDKNVWLPEKDQDISIAVRFDSLSSFTVFGMEYQYNPEVLHYKRYESIIEEPWSLLSFSNHEIGKIVIAGALLGKSSPDVTPDNAISLYFSKLLDSDTNIEYSVSLWDTDGKNKTYPVSKFLFSTEIPLPEKFVLHPNFPNPFNPATTIRYEIPVGVHVNILIYNILGQKVLTLVNQMKEAGYHQIVWNGKDQSGRSVSTGIYFLYFHTAGFSSNRKIILIK